MFSAYLENPTQYFFEGQDSDEKIVLLVRAHLITNLSWIIPAILIFLIPFFLPSAVLFLGFDLFSIPQTFLSALLIINYLLVLIITFEGFLYWYFNVNIITNKRVIDVDFESILFKNIDTAPLSMIQEANASVGGFLGIIFNFGHVFIQTAGAKVAIDMKNVPNPSLVADRIMDEAHGVVGP